MARSTSFISSLEKGFSILNTFIPENPSLTLAKVARANGLSMGTAHRYLLTFKKLGYITQDPETKRYRLTPKVLTLGFSVFRGMNLRSRIFPSMLEVARELDTTTQCAILDGTEIVYIERVRASGLVNLDLTTGSRLPAYCTSMGKAILAFLPEEESLELIEKMDFVKQTQYTITDKKALWEELKVVRARGYAINNQELTLGLRTLAAPIFKDGGRVEAAFGLSFPCDRVQGNNLESLYVEKLLKVSKEVSLEYKEFLPPVQ